MKMAYSNLPNEETELEKEAAFYALAEGPLESIAPFINPAMDSGYAPPDLEPLAFIDPFTGLAERALQQISVLFAELRSMPCQEVQSAQKKLLSMPSGGGFSDSLKQLLMACMNLKLDPLACLANCSLIELARLEKALTELAEHKMPFPAPAQALQERKVLQMTYQILQAEGIRRQTE